MRRTTIINRFCALLYSLFCLLLLSGCNPAPETPLRVGSVIWPGFEPLHLAKNLGYYDNSSIKLAELTSTTDVIHALRNGNLEAAALSLDEVLTLLDDGFEFSLILVMDFSEGGDVLMAKPYIQSLEDLRGKRIAIEYTTVGAILLDGVLSAAGLTPEDIKIVSCLSNQHLDCYSSSDAVVTFEPTKTKLLHKGARLLFDSSLIPNRITDVLVVKKEAVAKHPLSLKLLVEGYFKARNYLHNEPTKASKVMAPRMSLTPTEVLASFDGLRLPSLSENRALLEHQANGEPAPIRAVTESLAQFMLQKGFITNNLHINNFANPDFLPEQIPE